MSEWRLDFLSISLTTLFVDLAEVSFMLNTHFNEEVYIVEGDLEKIIPKSEFLPKLLQLCQLLEPFHQTLC